MHAFFRAGVFSRVRAGRMTGRLLPTTLVALLTVAGLVGGVLPVAAQSSDEALRAELERVQQERGRLGDALDEATARVGDLDAQLGEVRDQAAVLASEVEALDAQADTARAHFGEQVRQLYKGGAGADGLVGLMTGARPADVGARSHYLSALSQNEQAELETVAGLNRQLSRRRADMAAADERLAALTQEAAAARAELDQRLPAAGGVEAELRTEIARREEEARRLREEAERKRREAEEAARVAAAMERRRAEQEAAAAEEVAKRAEAQLREARAAAEPPPRPDPPAASRGGGSAPPPAANGMVCPQDQPRSFSDTWGAPRSGGRSHKGTDIFGTRGGNVFAITGGVVQTTKTGATSGLFLSLAGDDGNAYWYMHLQDFVASPGQRVSAGELIAHNGDTGNARGTSPHIHFEYHPGGGGAVNPYPLLRQVCG